MHTCTHSRKEALNLNRGRNTVFQNHKQNIAYQKVHISYQRNLKNFLNHYLDTMTWNLSKVPNMITLSLAQVQRFLPILKHLFMSKVGEIEGKKSTSLIIL